MADYVWLDTNGRVFVSQADAVIRDEVPAKPPPVLGISGYYDGMLEGCADCAESGNPAWDGTFTDHAYNISFGKMFSTWDVDGSYSIGGRALSAGRTILGHYGGLDYWEIIIRCFKDGYPTTYYTIWQGSRNGSTPCGTYTRDAGCSNVESLDIVEV